jgi:hypothetical protein
MQAADMSSTVSVQVPWQHYSAVACCSETSQAHAVSTEQSLAAHQQSGQQLLITNCLTYHVTHSKAIYLLLATQLVGLEPISTLHHIHNCFLTASLLHSKAAAIGAARVGAQGSMYFQLTATRSTSHVQGSMHFSLISMPLAFWRENKHQIKLA